MTGKQTQYIAMMLRAPYGQIVIVSLAIGTGPLSIVGLSENVKLIGRMTVLLNEEGEFHRLPLVTLHLPLPNQVLYVMNRNNKYKGKENLMTERKERE